MKISQLKKEAISKLSGKWGTAIGIGVLYFVFHLVLSLLLATLSANLSETVSSILSLVLSFILLPFSYGLLVTMVKLSRGENVGAIDFITIGLKNFVRVLKLNLRMIVKMWLPILLLILPIIVLGAAFYCYSDATISSDLVSILMIAAMAVEVIAMILMIIKTLSFSLSSYLLFDNQEATSNEILNKSAELMKGYKGKIVLLGFSFIGWFVLIFFATLLSLVINALFGVLVAFAGTFILEPYMSFATICFYEELKENDENLSTDNSSPITE